MWVKRKLKADRNWVRYWDELRNTKGWWHSFELPDGTTLALSGATITGGTINNGTASGTVVDSGTVLGLIDVTANSTINGNATASTTETVGAFNMQNGFSTITLNPVAGQSLSLVVGTTFGGYIAGATLELVGPGKSES